MDKRQYNRRRTIRIGTIIMIKRIHVNQHIIRRNFKQNENKPVLTIKTSKSNTYGNAVEILGESKVVYSPDKPLSCGAKVWIETTADVIIT
mgnify:FL=1|jgi:hypothetical protein